jgi:hypothetical protein
MDGKVRKPIPGKVCVRKKNTLYFLHDRARWRNKNYQSQNNARLTRVMGSRGV